MNNEEFTYVLNHQVSLCEDILVNKAKEYASDHDRLHNFRVAAALENVTPRQALAGMMAKHTVSIYDMCKADNSFSMDVWTEKLTDHINYLILLKAIVYEEAMDASPTLTFTSPAVYSP